MNMTLSKRGDYVMRSAIALARAYDAGVPRKIREVVAETEVPQTFASQILADLARAGLARSRAGRDGGYWLARPPSEISVLEVVEAGEGPLRADRCALGDGPCRWDAVCPLHETWSAATARLGDLLAATSLEKVAERDAAIEAGLYEAPPDAHRSHAVAVALSDVVQVELPDHAVRGELVRRRADVCALVAAMLEPDTGSADADGARHPGRVVDCALEPTGRQGRRPPIRFVMAWSLRGPGGATRFEGELAVEAVDPERSEVRVDGSWRHSAAHSPLSAEELEASARRVLRRFLRALAGWLESQSASEVSAGRLRSHAVVPTPSRPRKRTTAPARRSSTGSS